MTDTSRRRFLKRIGTTLVLASPMALSACMGGENRNYSNGIDARVDRTIGQMFAEFPKTRELAARSAGMLVMPVVTEAGFGFSGGGYGRGALRVGGVTADYYSAAKATFGLQLGANQYAHVLFFLTEDGLNDFRNSAGVSLGAEVDAATWDEGETYTADSTGLTAPIVSIIFGQAGARIGATLEGTKYTVLTDRDLSPGVAMTNDLRPQESP